MKVSKKFIAIWGSFLILQLLFLLLGISLNWPDWLIVLPIILWGGTALISFLGFVLYIFILTLIEDCRYNIKEMRDRKKKEKEEKKKNK